MTWNHGTQPPPDGEYVLGALRDPGPWPPVVIVQYSRDQEGWFHEPDGDFLRDEVEWWMPIPGIPDNVECETPQ